MNPYLCVRQIAISLLSMFATCIAFGQGQETGAAPGVPDPMTKVNYFQMTDCRINFYQVNDRYKVQTGSIFYIDREGFIINTGWDSVKVGDEYYIILTYPSYKRNKKGWIQGQDAPVYNYLTPARINAINTQLKGIPFKIKNAKKLTTTQLKQLNEMLPESLRIPMPENIKPTSVQADTLILLDSLDLSATKAWRRVALSGQDSLRLCIKKSEFDKLNKFPLYSVSLRKPALAFGQLTVPFKLRGATAGKNFSMTTDVTIGAYGGFKWRISRRQNFFLTLPVVVGLTFINVDDNTTTTTSSTASSVYPGWTLSTGLIAQLNNFNLGFVTGWDFASGVGKDWIYQGRNWISFGLGYSFLK